MYTQSTKLGRDRSTRSVSAPSTSWNMKRLQVNQVGCTAACPRFARSSRSVHLCWKRTTSACGALPNTAMQTTTEFTVHPEIQGPTNDTQFAWTKQWYPVAVDENVEAHRPTSFFLLGKEYVLWRDSSGTLRCFEDRCPHRLAPMSDGWVEGDTLRCSYHGWQFDGKGNCTHIPSFPSEEMEAQARSNKRTCIASYPVQSRSGLVFMWPECSPLAWIESAATEPHIIPDLEDESHVPMSGRWTQTDMPYGWEFFIENVVDPAHVPFAHHGFADINKSKAEELELETVEEVHPTAGFKNTIVNITKGLRNSSHEFRPPCLVLLTAGSSSGSGKQYLVLYAVPTRPGWVRHIGCTYLTKDSKGAEMLGVFTSKIPVWIQHLFAPIFLHGDLTILNAIDRTFKLEGSNWRRSYHLAHPADKGAAMFWNWFEKYAGGKIPFPTGMDGQREHMSREQMLDRYNQHTKNCIHCKKALHNVEKLKAATAIAAFMLMCAAVLSCQAALKVTAAQTAGSFAPPVFWALASFNPAALLLGSAVMVLAMHLLGKLRQSFYFVDYVRPS